MYKPKLYELNMYYKHSNCNLGKIFWKESRKPKIKNVYEKFLNLSIDNINFHGLCIIKQSYRDC